MTEIHEICHTALYEDQPLACFPLKGIHPWLYNNRQIINKETSNKGYASPVRGAPGLGCCWTR